MSERRESEKSESDLAEIKPRKTLTDLPEELLLYLASFLKGRDVIHLSHVNQHLFYTLSGSHHLWRRVWVQDKLYPDHVVECLAKKYAHQFGDDIHFDIVSYMLHMHVKCNWQNGVVHMIPPVPVKNIFGWGYDSQSLVALDNVSSCYRPEWVILVWDMVAKKLEKFPWDDRLPHPMHVNKVLVHEGVAVFHYDDVDGHDVVFGLDIAKRGSIKVLWCETAQPYSKWLVPDIGEYVCSFDKNTHQLSISSIFEGPANPKHIIDFEYTPFTFTCEHPWLAVAHHCTRSGGKEEILLINAKTKEQRQLICPPSHQSQIFNNGSPSQQKSLGKILLHDGKVYGLFAHESTLIWDGKTGELLQKVAHNGGLRFKMALSNDFTAIALEGRDKVVVYKTNTETKQLVEFSTFDVGKLEDGCDIILDAQLVSNCLVLYVSPRETHQLQLLIVPLLSTKPEDLKDKLKIVDVSPVLDLWNKFDSIVDAKLYVTPTLAMIVGDKQFQIIDFVSDVIS